MILDAIRKVPTAVLLNGDSPLFYKPSIPNPVQYFGFDLRKGPAQRSLQYRRNPLSWLPRYPQWGTIPMPTWVHLRKLWLQTTWLELPSDRTGWGWWQSLSFCHWRTKNTTSNRWALQSHALLRWLCPFFSGGWFTTHQAGIWQDPCCLLDARRPSISVIRYVPLSSSRIGWCNSGYQRLRLNALSI